MIPRSSLRAKRSIQTLSAAFTGLLRRVAPRDDGIRFSTSERQRRHNPHLLGRVELLHAERDDLRAFLNAAGDDDVVALVTFDLDRLQRDLAGVIDDVE